MASHPASYVSHLPLAEVLDGFETWSLMLQVVPESRNLEPSAEEWRRAYRNELIRRCAEENFTDGRAL